MKPTFGTGKLLPYPTSEWTTKLFTMIHISGDRVGYSGLIQHRPS